MQIATKTHGMPNGGGLAGWLLEAGRTVMARGLAASRRAPRTELRIVETLALGPKKQLILVSCGAERFLVGTGADSVQTIVRLGAEERALDETGQDQCG